MSRTNDRRPIKEVGGLLRGTLALLQASKKPQLPVAHGLTRTVLFPTTPPPALLTSHAPGVTLGSQRCSSQSFAISSRRSPAFLSPKPSGAADLFGGRLQPAAVRAEEDGDQL